MVIIRRCCIGFLFGHNKKMLYWIFIWSLVWSIGLLGAQTVKYDIMTQVCGLQKLLAIAKIIVYVSAMIFLIYLG